MAERDAIRAGSLVSLIRLRQVTLIPTAPIVAAATPAKAAGGKTK
jgi:hypothetical protein